MLSSDVGYEAHETRVLDRTGKVALFKRIELAVSAADDTTVRVEVLLERLDVFVVKVSSTCHLLLCFFF